MLHKDCKMWNMTWSCGLVDSVVTRVTRSHWHTHVGRNGNAINKTLEKYV